MGEFIIFGNMSLPNESLWIFHSNLKSFGTLAWPSIYIYTPFSLVPMSFLSPFCGTLSENGLIILIIKKQVFILCQIIELEYISTG